MVSRLLPLLLLFLGVAGALRAQDVHFTQFYASPLTLNPALTGAFDGRFRIQGVYRNQWAGVLDEPYQTFSTGIDLRFPLGAYGQRYKDAAAVGLVFFTDNVPGVELRTTQMAISGAFHKALDPRNSQYLSLGFQVGLTQRSINYNSLTFNDQFNGTTGYTFQSAEVFPQNNFAFADFAVGLNYSYSSPTTGLGFFAGASLFHLFQPNVSFYAVSDEDVEAVPLFTRYSAHVSANLPLSDNLSLQPRAMTNIQGPHFELTAGSNLRMRTGGYGNSAFHVGVWARPVQDVEDGLALDAVIGMIGFEYDNVLLGLSYDATLSGFRAGRRAQGAFEISLAYLGAYNNEVVLCPKF